MQFRFPQKSQVRGWFHWEHSGVLIPLFFFFGWAMVGIAISLSTTEPWLFISALVSFCLALIWTVVFWLTSDVVEERNPGTWSKNRRKVAHLKLQYKIYLAWKYVGCGAWVAIFIFCVIATRTIWNKKELSQMYGVLIPANDQSPDTACRGNLPDKALVLYFGGSTFFSSSQGVSIIKSQEQDILRLDRSPDGTATLTADIRDKDGKTIALISKNKFAVNRNSIIESLFYRPDYSTINLTDEYGNNFRVRYLNKQMLTFSGKLYFTHDWWIESGENGLVVMAGPGRNRNFRSSCFESSSTIIAVYP